MSNGVVLFKVTACIAGGIVAHQIVQVAARNLALSIDDKVSTTFGWTFFSKRPKPQPVEDKS